MDAGSIVELARSHRTPARFQQELLSALIRDVGADVGAFAIGPMPPATVGFRSDVIEDWKAASARHAAELAPILAAARGAASVDVRVLGEGRARSTRYFAEVVRPHGGRETLCAIPVWQDEPVGCLWLGRCGSRGRFHSRDLARVNAVLPTIAMASAAATGTTALPAWLALSPRETEIVDLLRRGLRSNEIAAALGTSPNTVRNQIWRLMARAGASTRAELIAVCPIDPE